MRKPLFVGVLSIALAVLLVPLALERREAWAPDHDEEMGEIEGTEELPPGLARRFAAFARFAPAGAPPLGEDVGGSGL